MPQANASATATATATAIYDHSQSMGMSMDMSFGGGDPVTARWLQSAGLQHLAATSASSASASSSSIDQQQQQQQHQHHRLLPNLFPQGYGVQPFDDKQKLFKMLKSMNLGMDSGSDSFTTSAPSSTEALFSSELRGEFAAGLLDLHSMDDTELLNDHPVAEPFETSPFFPAGDRGFGNESDPDLVIGNQQKVPADNMYRAPVPEREISGKESNLAKIKVVVRKRPLNKKELARKEEDIITVNDNNWLTVHEPKLKVDLTAYVEKHDFGFDAILDHHVSNDEVYRVTVEPIVPTIFQRTKATCFAYGQTGSGKTYTMQPLPLRACEDILKLMNQPYYQGQGFRLWLSFFEIYGGKLYDLLSDRKKLCMREDGRQQVCIVGLREFEVSDIQSVKEYIEKGSGTRSIGSTGANEESSRSHAILQLTIKKHSEGKDTKTGKTVGKLSFIDLAGSERGADTTDNDRQTRMEGAEINKSLLALKECIRALDNDQLHIPFRGSKLTEVLRDSFVGNSRTVMISCISPNSGSCEHTLNTLRYADRVKGLSKNSNLRKDQTVSGVAQLPKDSMSTSLSLPPGESKDVSDYNQSVVHAEASRRSTELQQYGNFSEDLDRNSSSLPPGMSSVVKEENGYAGYTDNRSNTRENTIGSASQRPSSNASNSFDTYVEEKAQKASITSRKISREDKPEKQPKWGLREDKPDPYTLRRQQQQAKDISTTDYDHDINAILQEEEALIAAHRKEIEDTMELVREEMQLLTDVEQPGSLIDDYVSKLSIVLSHKAAGLVSLQAQLARFQKRLKQHEISSLRKTMSSK